MVVVPELSPEAPEMLRAEDAMTSIAWLPPEMVTWSPARFTEPLLAVMPVPEAFVTDTVGAVREMTLRSQVPETDFAKMVESLWLERLMDLLALIVMVVVPSSCELESTNF